jgi:hypothetical protein
MQRRYAPALGLLLLLASGCASGPPFIDKMQPQALSMAENRARFALNCPNATGSVVNREELQPLVFGGPVRARYSIGVTGCDKRMLVDVLCSENNNQCIEGR